MKRYASAILLSPDNRLILQVRDDKPGVVDRGKLSLFAGEIESAETPSQAIQRELLEETGLQPKDIHFFIEHDEQQAPRRTSYVFLCPNIEPNSIRINEGQGYMLVDPRNGLDQYPIAEISLNILQKYLALTKETNNDK